MADVTISELPVASSVVGTDVIPVSNGTSTSRASLSQIVGLVPTPSSIPSGVIVMWSGSVSSIPSGWSLCDGTNGTPNLADRFVVGYSGTKPINSLGGSATASGATDSHTLTLAQIPSHTHTLGTRYNGGGSNCNSSFACNTTGGGSSQAAFTTSAAGSTQGHTHNISTIATIPPYYAIAFIMKL